MNKYVLILFLTFALIGSAAAKAPDFGLESLDGEWIEVGDYLGSDIVILDFWATWCKPCLKNLPKLQKLHLDYEEKNVRIFAVNEDGTRSQAKVQPMVSSLGLTMSVLLDTDREVMRLYQVQGLPATLVIDTDGEIVKTLRGYRPGDEQVLRDTLDALLEDAE